MNQFLKESSYKSAVFNANFYVYFSRIVFCSDVICFECKGMRYLHYIKNCTKLSPCEEKVCGAATAPFSPKASLVTAAQLRHSSGSCRWALRDWGCGVGGLALLHLGVCHLGLLVQSVQPQPLLRVTLQGLSHILQFSFKVRFTPHCSLLPVLLQCNSIPINLVGICKLLFPNQFVCVCVCVCVHVCWIPIMILGLLWAWTVSPP